MSDPADQSTTLAAVNLSPSHIFEALLFASDEPVSAARFREIAPELGGVDLKKLMDTLNAEYENTHRVFRIHQVAGGYQMFTLPEFADVLERLYARRQQNRLSAKALETLAIIAYKQPITRAEIEQIRGVNADGVLRTLLSKNLIAISGTAQGPGNPFLYTTSRQFLEYFGLKSLQDLPRLKELDEIVAADPEVKERFGEEFLKELEPAVLGLEENGKVNDDDEDEREE